MARRRSRLLGRRSGAHWRDVARLAVFERCDRRTLRRAAEWGDLIEVDAGETLLRENHGDYWFFVLVQGRVELSKAGAPLASVGAGSHFGEAAIIGLRPQPATVTTRERSMLFVLGARQVISLLADAPAFQQAVFPAVTPGEFRHFVKRSHGEARAEWQRLMPRQPARVTALPAVTARPPGRVLSLPDAVAVVGHLPRAAPADRVPPRVPPPIGARHRAWTMAAAVAATALLLSGVALRYHPPRLVITAGRPIDIASDISITGTPVHRPTGHYLLLTVRARQPNLAGLVRAAMHGEPTIALQPEHLSAADKAAATRAGRQQYEDSQQAAIAAAAVAAGVDARRLSVRIRGRDLVGPSAGLVYALAITDMLTGRDLGAGRVVAATGAVERDGRLDAVGWVGVKAASAAGAHATVLLVPAGQQAAAFPSFAVAYGVADLRAAIVVLQQTRPDRPPTA